MHAPARQNGYYNSTCRRRVSDLVECGDGDNKVGDRVEPAVDSTFEGIDGDNF